MSASSARRRTRLVAAVRAELEAAGTLDSFLGQLALVLAGRLGAESSGAVSLSRELRTVMAAALGEQQPAGGEPGSDGAAGLEDPDDELAELREERDRIARHAAAGRA